MQKETSPERRDRSVRAQSRAHSSDSLQEAPRIVSLCEIPVVMTQRQARFHRPPQLLSRAGIFVRPTQTPCQASEVQDSAAAARDPSTRANTPEKDAR